MSVIVKNKVIEQAKLQQAVAGCAVFPAGQPLGLAGQSVLPSDLVATFEAAQNAIDAVEAAKAALASAVAAQKAARNTANVSYRRLRLYAIARWGVGSPQVASFGFSAAVPKARSATSKTLAAAKAQRTKQARGVLGKRKRAKVTVDGAPGLQFVAADGSAVPGVVPGAVAPATASAASAAGKSSA